MIKRTNFCERLAQVARIVWKRLARRLGYGVGPHLMSELRKAWILLRHPHATIEFGESVYLGPGFSLHLPWASTFIAGAGTEFRRGFRAEIAEPSGRIAIGANSVFTHYVLIQCSTSIEIGERCMFGQSSIIVDGNHRFRDLDTPMLEQGFDFRPVRIGNDATVTTKCTIIADIGERAFIGANSVVTRPVSPYTLAAGVPAREIEYFGPEDEQSRRGANRTARSE